jgi:quinohemoprotein ethanol dehydrogenase
VPDLRRSNKTTFDIFAGIVIGGAYLKNGMPIFYESISLDQVSDLKAYIIDKAWDAYDSQNAKRY